MLSRAPALLTRGHDDRPRGRIRRRIVTSGALAAAGMAAVPVAADLGDDPVAVGTARHTPMVAESVGDDPGIDRWYSAAEARDLAPEPEPEPDPEPEEETVTVTADDAEEPAGDVAQPASATPERNRWDRLADCESGEWVNGGESFIEGSARWDYGIDFAHEGYEQFQGGLNFHPGTWDAYRDPDMPGHAGHATREQEIIVAERVLADQGWGAWPRCSRMVGLR